MTLRTFSEFCEAMGMTRCGRIETLRGPDADGNSLYRIHMPPFRPLRPPGPWRDELARFAATLPAGARMAEVGSYAGESAEIFLASGRVGLLLCVDEWSATADTFPPAGTMAEAEAEFDRRAAGYSACVKVKRTSLDAAALLPDGILDAVYIDGDHRYESVLADLRAWRPKVKPGGILAGHDWWLPDVRRAATEVMGREPDEVYGDGQPEGTWVYRL